MILSSKRINPCKKKAKLVTSVNYPSLKTKEINLVHLPFGFPIQFLEITSTFHYLLSFFLLKRGIIKALNQQHVQFPRPFTLLASPCKACKIHINWKVRKKEVLD